MESPSRLTTLLTPLAIVLGFGLVAVAIYLNGTSSDEKQQTRVTAPNESPVEETDARRTLREIAPVTESDHIRGNPDAEVVFVEYSDFDCPFCKQFHGTMKEVVSTYDDIAWVYRQLPLTDLHKNARTIAEASECVATLNGNEAFWKFADLVFEERGVNEATDLTRLSEFAIHAGVNEEAFERCRESGNSEAAVTADEESARKLGARGTPYTIVSFPDGEVVIPGAVSFADIEPLLEEIREESV